MAYLIALVTMIAGTAFVLGIKGVLAVRANEDSFDFFFFVLSNKHRLFLAALLIASISIAMALNPLNFEVIVSIISIYSDWAANLLQYGSPFVIGIAVGGLVLMLPSATSGE